jgi:hypothetical protein
MYARLVLPSVILAVAFGCSKKKDPAADLPGPAYTLTLRHERQGDKTFVTQESNENNSEWARSKIGKSHGGRQEYKRFEFTEHVVAMPEGADMPTEYTRAYSTAVYGQSKEYNQKYSISGKTVTVKKTPTGLSITADGQPLTPMEDGAYRPMLERKKEAIRDEDILPKKAVKVNEMWEIDADTVAAVGEALKLPSKKEQSRGTCKLVSVTEKGGKQWSVIEATIELAVSRKYFDARMVGTVTVAITLDAVTDGSANEGTMKTSITGELKNDGGRFEGGYNLNTQYTETRAPAK